MTVAHIQHMSGVYWLPVKLKKDTGMNYYDMTNDHDNEILLAPVDNEPGLFDNMMEPFDQDVKLFNDEAAAQEAVLETDVLVRASVVPHEPSFEEQLNHQLSAHTN